MKAADDAVARNLERPAGNTNALIFTSSEKDSRKMGEKIAQTLVLALEPLQFWYE